VDLEDPCRERRRRPQMRVDLPDLRRQPKQLPLHLSRRIGRLQCEAAGIGEILGINRAA
jgi:hypothetical protein